MAQDIIDLELINKALNYQEYLEHIAVEIKTADTSDPQKANLIHYTSKNLQLMNSLNDKIELTAELRQAIDKLPHFTWVVFTEGWCGDAAQIVPVLNQIATASSGKISLLFLLRDQHPAIMDHYLTNGSRSIPKLVVLDKDLNELAVWGPRPSNLQVVMDEWKKENLTLKELIPRVNTWYLNDNTHSTQKELVTLINSVAS